MYSATQVILLVYAVRTPEIERMYDLAELCLPPFRSCSFHAITDHVSSLAGGYIRLLFFPVGSWSGPPLFSLATVYLRLTVRPSRRVGVAQHAHTHGV